MDEDHLLAIAAIEQSEYPPARMIFAELQHEAYIARAGPCGIKLDNNEFGRLADGLFYECRWEAFQRRSRRKHYEGWEQHEWA